ncbi:hypothetical protein CEV34_1460 [Brucella pseudogrignonensis]|uniref:Uncharacterized protein n=1 Tax=Brucella pseudogrignonensis TaxID=419475 RepID=A0A256GMF3_9HYPH|nr:hypothetical protein CEV34_1460 [Brucella pseudogrignonensis]
MTGVCVGRFLPVQAKDGRPIHPRNMSGFQHCGDARELE